MAAHRFVSLLEDRAKSWTLVDPDLGPETFFIGAIRGGDLYNRVPVMARIDGTRRYPAPRTYDEARAELEAVGRHVADEFGLDVEVVCHRSGQPFVVDPASRLVQTFQAAATEVMGAPLPVRASILATDMNHIVSTTGIPAVLHGPDIRRAHATPEWVPVDDVFRAARVFLRTALRFLS
jgi:acetylornithine deacetylase/succinyl-diaminopimelate desuccinylase-like protein